VNGKREWVRRGSDVRELWHLRAVPGIARRFRRSIAACGAVINRGEPVTVWAGAVPPPAHRSCPSCLSAYEALRGMDDEPPATRLGH
jgi:hypothetical protein